MLLNVFNVLLVISVLRQIPMITSHFRALKDTIAVVAQQLALSTTQQQDIMHQQVQ